MQKPNLSKLPRRWTPFMFATCLFGMICLLGYYFMSSKTQVPAIAKVQQVNKESIEGLGGEGTPAYNEMMMADNSEREQQAAAAGKSYVPTLVGLEAIGGTESLLEFPKETSKKEPPPTAGQVGSTTSTNHTPRGGSDQNQQARLSAMMSYINGIRQAGRMEGSPQSVTMASAFSSQPGIQSATLNSTSTSASSESSTLPLIPGDILYAVNELTITSVTPGTPVLASVVHGPLQGAKIMGTFQAVDARLIVQFSSISLAGKNLPINGYGIDPATSQASVATEVERHTFAKWAGFLAASFAEGLGVAMQATGTVRVSGPNESWTFKDRYKPEEQAMVAGGKMGERVANQLEKNWDTPPTVTLRAGTAIGILITK